MLKNVQNGVIFSVKVIPGASCNTIVGWENEELKIRLTAVPEKGKANDQLITFLSKRWKLPKNAFSIQTGKASRQKKIHIEGVTAEKIAHYLSLESNL
jgi:uncharacterized protein (TIGR00251 family)